MRHDDSWLQLVQAHNLEKSAVGCPQTTLEAAKSPRGERGDLISACLRAPTSGWSGDGPPLDTPEQRPHIAADVPQTAPERPPPAPVRAAPVGHFLARPRRARQISSRWTPGSSLHPTTTLRTLPTCIAACLRTPLISTLHSLPFPPPPFKMIGFVSGVAAVSSARRAPSAVCTRSSFAGAAVVAAPVVRATMRMSNIQETIQTEIAKAKEASDKFGKTSKEAAAAWYVLHRRCCFLLCFLIMLRSYHALPLLVSFSSRAGSCLRLFPCPVLSRSLTSGPVLFFSRVPGSTRLTAPSMHVLCMRLVYHF